MKFKDLLLESPTDTVARFYKEASAEADRFYNLEDVKYKEKNKKYYDEHFKSWFSEEIIPVFTKPVDKPQPEYTNHPKPGKLQSPGYRGFNYALQHAGLPYNKDVQGYTTDASRMLASHTMDEVGNNNGN